MNILENNAGNNEENFFCRNSPLLLADHTANCKQRISFCTLPLIIIIIIIIIIITRLFFTL